MTNEQFEFLATVIHASGLSRKGCRLVLVEGMRQCDAARALDIEPNLITVSIRRYRELYAEIIRLFADER